jgi:hypothetical protein
MGPLKRLQLTSLSLALLIGISSAFTTMNTPSRTAASNKRPRICGTKRYLITDSSAVESFHSLLDLQSSMAPTTGFSITRLSPDVEAEVFTDICHVIMVFSGFFCLSRPLLQLFSVLVRNRIIVVSSPCSSPGTGSQACLSQ